MKTLAKLALITFFALALSLVLPGKNSFAGQVFYDHTEDLFVIQIEGRIDKPMLDDFVNTLTLYVKEKNAKPIRVYLDSHGGSLDHAMVIGQGIRTAQAETWIGSRYVVNGVPMVSSARCASACMLLFIAGTQRVMPAQSNLGVHQFRCAKCTSEQTQHTVAQMFKYARDMEVDPAIIEAQLYTSHAKMKDLDHRWLKKVGIITSTQEEYQQKLLAQASKKEGRK